MNWLLRRTFWKFSLKAAQEQGASRIRAIRLSIGPFCGIVPECIQIYLDVLAKEPPPRARR